MSKQILTQNLIEQADAVAFIRAMEALERVKSTSEFIDYFQRELQTVLPHGAFVCWVGKVGLGWVVQPMSVLTAQIPMDFVDLSDYKNSGNFHLNWQEWWKTGAPIFFDQTENDSQADPKWLEYFKASDLQNVASFGVLSNIHEYASCFSFYRLPRGLREKQNRALKWFVPHLHNTYLKLLDIESILSVPKKTGELNRPLSRREREVLEWIRRGKTNAEIASILGVAFKTVKNQVQNILVKLHVNNRAQAVAAALENGVIKLK